MIPELAGGKFRSDDRTCISMGDKYKPTGISWNGMLFSDPHCVYFYTGEGCFCDAKTKGFTPGGQYTERRWEANTDVKISNPYRGVAWQFHLEIGKLIELPRWVLRLQSDRFEERLMLFRVNARTPYPPDHLSRPWSQRDERFLQCTTPPCIHETGIIGYCWYDSDLRIFIDPPEKVLDIRNNPLGTIPYHHPVNSCASLVRSTMTSFVLYRYHPCRYHLISICSSWQTQSSFFPTSILSFICSCSKSFET